ncbi:MAG: hypothetical protein Q9193_002976 [Seirophora villosa]
MERETGAHPFQAPSRRDTEAYCERKTLPNMTSRLIAILRGNTRMQVRGPVDEAVEKGARLYSIDSASFLANFNAIKSTLMIRADTAFEIIVRAPGEDRFMTCKDIYFTIACIAPADLMCSEQKIFSASTETCFVAENPTKDVWLLPWQRHIRDRVRREAMIYMTSSLPGWTMPEEMVKSIANPSIIERYLVHPQLPSMRSSQVSNDLDLVWSIKWPDQLSKYNGDLENYIWRPHALVIFSSTRLLRTFKKQFTSDLPVFSSTTAPLHILLHMIHAVFRVALSETRDFMQDAQQQVFDMTLKSRLHPSKEKFQHLLYLKDCGKYAGRDMTHNKEMLYAVEERVKHMIPANDGSEEARLLEKLVSEVKEDLEYAEKELERIGKSIGDLRKDVFAHA